MFTHNKKRTIRALLMTVLSVAVLACMTVFLTASAASADSVTASPKTFESNVRSDLVDPSHFMFKPNAVYNGSFRSELLAPEAMIYDAFVDHFVTRQQTDDITVNLEEAGYAVYDWDTARDMIVSAYAAFFLDHPEMYWASSGFSMYDIYLRNNCVTSFVFSPSEAYTNAKSEMTTVYNGINTVVSEIASLRPSTSRYDTVKTIHDYICNKMTYDYGAVGSTYIGDAHSVAPLFGGGSRGNKYVCEGYARSLKLLCDRFNIPCVEVVGDAGGGHAWNYVQMEDGKWYAVDTTWDDQGSIMYTYFLIGKNTRVFENKKFSEDHTPENQALVTETVNPLAYPVLSDEKYEPGSTVEETFDFIGESAVNNRVVDSMPSFTVQYTGVVTSGCQYSIYVNDDCIWSNSVYEGSEFLLAEWVFQSDGTMHFDINFGGRDNGSYVVKVVFVKADGTTLTASRTVVLNETYAAMTNYFEVLNWPAENETVQDSLDVIVHFLHPELNESYEIFIDNYMILGTMLLEDDEDYNSSTAVHSWTARLGSWLGDGLHRIDLVYKTKDGTLVRETRYVTVDTNAVPKTFADYCEFVNWPDESQAISGNNYPLTLKNVSGLPNDDCLLEVYLDGSLSLSCSFNENGLFTFYVDTISVGNGIHNERFVFRIPGGGSVETEKSIYIYNHPAFSLNTLGASIRLSEPWGIRFGIQLDKNDAFSNTQIVEYGTLIIASGTLGNNDFTVDTPSVRKIKATNLLENDSTHITYTGVLINIPTSFFNTKVKGRGYLIYVGSDGNQHVYYSQIAEKSFNGVAQAAYDSYSRIQNPTDAQKEALRKLKAILGIE